jgi:hypothetical protein
VATVSSQTIRQVIDASRMKTNIAVVVTSISPPNEALRTLAGGCAAHGFRFVVVGDAKSPADFQLDGCDFFDLKKQAETGFRFAEVCPTGTYARKNIGYLISARAGCEVIKETDDDNIPYEKFWAIGETVQSIPTLFEGGWVNVYRYFSNADIWPRGLPLDAARLDPPALESLANMDSNCPIQQGLSDNDPDVDAIYRIACTLPQFFNDARPVALGSNSWCPFNSQNTTWRREAFPLMYLPSSCSMRMTDIWRSFVAQRIAWSNDWKVLFHGPTVRQERNRHDLLNDLRDELPGYLNNRLFCEELEKLLLRPGLEHLGENLRLCYEKLISMKLIDRKELTLIDAWLTDLKML